MPPHVSLNRASFTMRLLNVHDLSFREFYGDNTPPYVITSHRWSDDEATFKDVLKKRNTSSKGWAKIQGFCERVRQDNEVLKTLENATCCDWLWIDTACIDQRSTAEVSESINSMWRWYDSAVECHAYLADVLPFGADRGIVEVLDDFAESEWFQRGWTLQELLAPRCVIFFTQAWEIIGHKCSQCDTKRSCEGAGPLLNARIAQVTGIPEAVLRDFEQSKPLGVEEKMKWQLGRRTTRLEDQAYCLLGIFDVNMPLIYGEGLRAIERLERTIFEELQRPWKSQLTFDLAGALKATLVSTALTGAKSFGRPLAIMRFSDVDGEVACVCDFADDDGDLIACDVCEKWQHLVCYFGSNFHDALTADLEHRCFTCQPRSIDAQGARLRQREIRRTRAAQASASSTEGAKRRTSAAANPKAQKRNGRRSTGRPAAPSAKEAYASSSRPSMPFSVPREQRVTKAALEVQEQIIEKADVAGQSSCTTSMSRVMRVLVDELMTDESEFVDHARFEDLGIESLLALTISGRLSQQLGISISPTLFTTYPTVGQLRGYFAQLDEPHTSGSQEDHVKMNIDEPPNLGIGSADQMFEFSSTFADQRGPSFVDDFNFDSFLHDENTTHMSPSNFSFGASEPEYLFPHAVAPTSYTGSALQPFSDWNYQPYPFSPTTHGLYSAPIPQSARPTEVTSVGPQDGRDMASVWNSKISQIPGAPTTSHQFPSLYAQAVRSHKCPISAREYHVKGFARIYDLTRHTLTHFKGTISCDFCPGNGIYGAKTFNRIDVLKRHLTSVHDVQQVALSSECAGKDMSSAHARLALDTSTGATCSLCARPFASAQAFYDHLDNCVVRELVSSVEPTNTYSAAFLCNKPNCTSSFRRVAGLERHLRAVHGSEEQLRKFECLVPECEYRGERAFLRQDHLMRHQKTRHGMEYQHRAAYPTDDVHRANREAMAGPAGR
ncbi:hypothetical protein LTR95_006645 [Oleoguttula sp. CCFEE 5521]